MFGYVSANGKILLKPEYESIERILNYKDKENVYLTVMKSGKKGVYKNSKKIIDNLYQSIYFSRKSNIIVAKTSKNNIFYNIDGRKILNGKYTEYTLAGNYISVVEDDTKKIYDINGNFITNQSYKKIEATSNSNYIITVDDNNHYGIMNKSTNINENYINLKYAFDDYFIFTTEENKVGILNVWSGVVVKPEYESILKIENMDCFEAKNGDETTIFSKNLDKLITLNNAIVENIEEKYAVIYSENERIYIDKTGNVVSNSIIYKDSNLLSIKKDNKWGFADIAGNIKVNCEYDFVTEVNKYGFAGIKKDGKWGVINSKGEIVLEPKYEIETYYLPQFIGNSYIEQSGTVHCIKLEN